MLLILSLFLIIHPVLASARSFHVLEVIGEPKKMVGEEWMFLGVGDRLADTQIVDVDKNDRVTILAEDGETCVLSGRYGFLLANLLLQGRVAVPDGRSDFARRRFSVSTPSAVVGVRGDEADADREGSPSSGVVYSRPVDLWTALNRAIETNDGEAIPTFFWEDVFVDSDFGEFLVFISQAVSIPDSTMMAFMRTRKITSPGFVRCLDELSLIKKKFQSLISGYAEAMTRSPSDDGYRYRFIEESRGPMRDSIRPAFFDDLVRQHAGFLYKCIQKFERKSGKTLDSEEGLKALTGVGVTPLMLVNPWRKPYRLKIVDDAYVIWTATPDGRVLSGASLKKNTLEAEAVTFRIKVRDNSQPVFLAGEFNQWTPEKTPMEYRKQKGVWEATVELKPGSHQYKFVQKGKWFPDPGRRRRLPDGHGGANSVVEVE